MKTECIALQGLPNTRDLGGLPAGAGKRIRPHRLIRSGELLTMTASDLETLQGTYNLQRVVDFRTLAEQQERPDPKMPGVTYISHPILDETAMGVTREEQADRDVMKMLMEKLGDPSFSSEQYLAAIYEKLILDDFSRGQYRRFFEILLAAEEGATLWHCTAGKDRVGTGTALLLQALGTPLEVIMQDFMATNEFCAPVREMQMQKIEQATGSRQAAEQLSVLFSVCPSYLEAVWKAIDKAFGGFAAFMEKEMGMDAAKLARLQELYTA